MGTQPTKKSGSGAGTLVVIFIIIVAGVAASNFLGPAKGWLQKLTEKKIPQEEVVKPVGPVKTEPETIVEVKPEIKTPEQKPEIKEPEFSVKKIYDDLFDKYRKKFPDPTKGETYTVYLKSGKKLSGKLKDFSDGKVVIQRPGVTATYRLDICHQRSYPKLFPKKATKVMALKELKKILDEREAAKAAELAKKNPPEVATKKISTSTVEKIPPKPFAYDPSPADTPGFLKKPLTAFGDWVMVQQRRIGGKIGEKIYAKKQPPNVVLYVKTSKLFRQQDYDVRFTVAEGMWQIWGFKCLDYGAANATSQTHLVLLDNNNRIIGGSTKNDASNIWVKK